VVAVTLPEKPAATVQPPATVSVAVVPASLGQATAVTVEE
jgi:hypothetical protein